MPDNQENPSSRIALLGIIVEKRDAAGVLNDTLHEFAAHIVGRMGVPYPKRGISIISVIVDAPNPVISSLAGRLGMIDGVTVKTLYSK